MNSVIRTQSLSLFVTDWLRINGIMQVAPYKRIRKVAFIASVPKNPSGKILRKDLIQLATKSPKL